MTRNFRVFLFVLLFSLVFRLVISPAIYSGDVNNHVGWGYSNLIYGFSGAYDREYTGIMQPTYPPISLYAFTTSTGLYHLVYQLATTLNQSFAMFPSGLIWLLEDQDVLPAFNKVAAIVSDLGIGLLIYRLLRLYFPRRPRLALIGSIAYLANPAVWYNSALWGQIESFPLFFILLSFWLVLTRKSIPAHAAFVFALLIKQSSIIFIPIFLLLSWQKFGLKQTVKGIFVQVLIFYSAFIPFFSRPDWLWPFQVYLNRLQTGSGSNYITDHAFNVWIWVTHLAKVPDTTPILGPVPAVWVGYFIFGLPVALIFLKLISARLTYSKLFLSSALLPMLSFLLLTKMHERYFAPALPFLILAAAKYRFLWIIYLIVSLAHWANIYHIWWFPRFPALVTWLSQWSTISFMAILFIVGTVVTLIYFFASRHETDL